MNLKNIKKAIETDKENKLCATCKNLGYYTDKFGTVRTCLNCLDRLGEEQHAKY